MTYPQQYQPQVQHIDPRYAQQYAPQGYPGAVVTYPQPPAQAGPQQQGQGVVPSTPKLGDGGGSGGQASPKLRHLDGRTIVVLPHRVDEDAMDPETKAKRPEAHFDLIVVDGGPLRYGDNVDDRKPEKNRPNTHEIDTPCIFVNASDIGGSFVSCVRDALAAGEPGRAGVIERGNKGFRPYLITRCGEHVDRSTRADGQQKYDAAMRIFDLVWQDKHDRSGGPKRFVSPEPRSLVAPPVAPQQQVAYGAPAQQAYVQPNGAAYAPQQAYQPVAPAGYAQQQYRQAGTVPTPYGAAPAQQLHPEYVAAATQPAYGQQQPYATYGQPQSAPPAQYQEQQFQAGPHGDGAMAMPPAQAGPPLPPPVEAWLASLDPAQRDASRAAYIAQQPPQGSPGPAQAAGRPGI